MKQILRETDTQSKTIAIIGGGISGLMSGILALKENYKVTIFEKNRYLGGAFKDSLDYGYANNYLLIGTAYDKVRKNLNSILDFSFLFPIDTDYIYVYKGGTTIFFYSDLNKLKNELISISPFDVKIIEDLIQGIKEASKLDYSFNETKKFSLFDKDSRQTNSFYNKYGKKTIEEYASKIKNEDIRKALCNFISPKNSICQLMLIMGLYASKRLTRVNNPNLILEKLIEEFERNGGQVKLNCEVKRLGNKKNAVSVTYGSDDIEEKFDDCIYACDCFTLFEYLINRKYLSANGKFYFNHNLESNIMSSFSCVYSFAQGNSDIMQITNGAYYSGKVDKKFRVGCKNNDEFKLFIKDNRLTISFNLNDDDYQFFKLIRKNNSTYKKEINRISSDIEDMLAKQLGVGKLNLEKVFTPVDFENNFYQRKGGINGIILSPSTIGASLENEIKGFDHLYISSAGLYRPFWFYSAAVASLKAIDLIKKYNNKE